VLTDRFVIDEAGFAFNDEAPEALEQAFAAFSELLSYANGTQQGVAMSSLVWWVESGSGMELHEHLQDPRLNRDGRLLLLRQLDKVRIWDGLDPEPPSDVTIDGSVVIMAPGIALCTLRAIAGHGTACLTTLQAARSGVLEVALPDSRAGLVSFLTIKDDAPAFWRRLADLENLDAEAIGRIRAWAFPRLLFVPEVWGQINSFEGGFRDVVRAPFLRDLAGLNDHALAVWHEEVEPAKIQAVMAARARVSCSRESPKTHKNTAAMRQRQVEFDGRSISCEWHTKLEPHRNRVHFAVEAERVIVGLFTRHLL
jgi:hypothetical protein